MDLLEFDRYSSIKRNGRTYRVKNGSLAHRKWLTEMRHSNRRFKMPNGFRWLNGKAEKTNEFMQWEKRVKNELHAMLAPNIDIEAPKDKSERVAIKEYVTMFNRDTPIEEKSLPNLTLKTVTVKKTVNISSRQESVAKSLALYARALYYFLKSKKKIPENADVSIKLLIKNGESDNPASIVFRKSTLESFDDMVHSAEGWVEKYPSISVSKSTAGVVNIVPLPSTGACDSEDVSYRCLKNFMPDTRIWLSSPKSTNDNCGIACVLRFMGIPGNKVKSSTIREILRLPSGPLHYEDDMRRVFEHFKINAFVYVHPITKPDDYKYRYEYPQGSDKTIHLHLVNGHYEYEHKSRTSYFMCIKCGKGSRKGKDGVKMKAKAHFEGQSECTECNVYEKSYYESKIKGMKRLVDIVVKPEEKITRSNIVLFDLETFQPERQSLIYAVGYMLGNEEEPTILYGQNAMDDFVDWAMKQKNKVFVAYNGARFDHYFLVDKLMRKKADIEYQKFVYSEGRLMGFEFGEGNKIWDLYLFTLCELSKAGKTFGAEVSKGDFDHSKINSWEDVKNHREESVAYLRKDVLVLKQVYKVFSDMIYKMEGVEPANYMTLSQMAFKLWRRSISGKGYDIYMNYTREEYKAIREAIYGGRCYPGAEKFVGDASNYIIASDVTSLYPAAMRGCDTLRGTRYPYGEHIFTPLQKQTFEKGGLGIYHISYVPPSDIIEPVLPRREKHKLVWDLKPSSGYYTSVDISEAIKYGYKIEFTEGKKAVVWTETTTHLFRDYVDKYIALKNLATHDKDEVTRAIAKILLNSLYGKMLQRPIQDSKIFPETMEEVWEWNMEHELEDINFFEEAGRCMITGKKIENELYRHVTKPCHLGAFILGYSRKIMNSFADIISPGLKVPYKYYCDTDSMYISGENWEKLKDAGCVDESGETLGKLSNDTKKGSIITEAWFRAPKTYGCKVLKADGKVVDKLGIKGIPSKNVDEPITYEDVKNLNRRSVKFDTFEKIGVKTDRHGRSPFSIDIHKVSRQFMKNDWTAWDMYSDGFYRPKGYIALNETTTKANQ